jgi:hypothetical protein
MTMAVLFESGAKAWVKHVPAFSYVRENRQGGLSMDILTSLT